jgi:hypothetical protein
LTYFDSFSTYFNAFATTFFPYFNTVFFVLKYVKIREMRISTVPYFNVFQHISPRSFADDVSIIPPIGCCSVQQFSYHAGSSHATCRRCPSRFAFADGRKRVEYEHNYNFFANQFPFKLQRKSDPRWFSRPSQAYQKRPRKNAENALDLL